MSHHDGSHFDSNTARLEPLKATSRSQYMFHYLPHLVHLDQQMSSNKVRHFHGLDKDHYYLFVYNVRNL